VSGKNAGSGGVRAGADDVASVDQILVGEHVVGGGLGITAGSDAVGEVGEEAPVLKVEDAAADFGPVGVNVDEAGNDGFAGDVDDFGVGGDCEAAGFADGDDAIVFDEDVGVFEDVIAVHGDDASATEDGLAGGSVAGEGEIDGDDFGFQLGEFFLVVVFGRLGGSGCFGIFRGLWFFRLAWIPAFRLPVFWEPRIRLDREAAGRKWRLRPRLEFFPPSAKPM